MIEFSSLLISLVCVCSAAPPEQPWFPKAPPLPKPTGDVVRVATSEELFRAAAGAKPRTTILVADGHYFLSQTLHLTADNVMLRGASSDRHKVILDGAKSNHGELVAITGCRGATIANLTLQNVRHNCVKLNADKLAQQVTVYNCVIHNVWQRGVKGPFVPENEEERLAPRDCRIQYCLFYNDRAKTFDDDPDDKKNGFNGNYVGGIDAMQARGWTIADNVFIGIRGRTGEARGAVFLWQDSRDCVVERNIIIDCDTGICLGNSSRSRFSIHCTNCTVRNNFVTRAPENGILADYTRDCRIVYNSIHDPESRMKRLIRLVHDNDGLLVANNLLSGPPLRNESQSEIKFGGNVVKVLTAQFRDAAKGDLHLNAAVVGVTNAATRLSDVTEDIDRQPRREKTDVGADQAEALGK